MVANISPNQAQSTLPAYQDKKTDRPDGPRSSSSEKNNALGNTSETVSLRSGSTLNLTYSSTMQLSASDEAKYTMLQSLVANLLNEQGINTKIALGTSEIDIATVTPTEAQELVSEDGYFGIEQTSDRIVQFAIGIAAGDPSRIDAIKKGVEQGFAEAKQAFGGELPDISYDTYDAVMKKLDDWVTESTKSVP